MAKRKSSLKPIIDPILDPMHNFANDIELGTYVDARERYDHLTGEEDNTHRYENWSSPSQKNTGSNNQAGTRTSVKKEVAAAGNSSNAKPLFKKDAK